MRSKLFRLSASGYEPISFDDLENKSFWCKFGNKQESAFVDVMQRMKTPYSIKIHPAKSQNPYHPDLLVSLTSNGSCVIETGEVKIKNSPLFYADKNYKIPSQYALTMDLKDSFNYMKLLNSGVDLVIFIWVLWEAHKMEVNYNGKTKEYFVDPMKGIWVTRFSKLRLYEELVKPPIHWYNNKGRQPTQYIYGQEKTWCDELLAFEPRLRDPETKLVNNITSDGYTLRQGEKYPRGNSSCSYVFNLMDRRIFNPLFFKVGN